jgi:ABC-type transport system involved in multi-copper enzyme maturation permease subunit
VLLCILRQARLKQMVWVAVGLLILVAVFVGVSTAMGRWTLAHRHFRWADTEPEVHLLAAPRPGAASVGKSADGTVRYVAVAPPHTLVMSFSELAESQEAMSRWPWWSPATRAYYSAFAGACAVLLQQSAFYVFSNWIVFSIVVGFLLPAWSLSFATEALGGEREGRTLIWLLTRPMQRWSVYLAKFVALLPWSLGLNLGGFALLCLLAGRPGRLAFHYYWPAVLLGTLAFCALYHLMAACFRRPAVVALVYSFFLEILLGNMPGYMKRVSIGFYTRCLMFDRGAAYNVMPEKASIYLPVSGATATAVLISATAVLLLVGMAVFSKAEYKEVS